MKGPLSIAIALLRNLNRAIETALRPIGAALVVAMLCTVVWGVIARLAGISSPWTDSGMLIMLPSLAFVIAPLAYRRSANVTLDLLKDSLPPRWASVHAVLMHLFILLILLIGLDLTLRKIGVDPGPLSRFIALVCGLNLSEIRPFAMPMRVPIIGIQWSTIYTIMPISIALMIAANLELLLRNLQAFLDPQATKARPIRSIEDSASRLWD